MTFTINRSLFAGCILGAAVALAIAGGGFGPAIAQVGQGAGGAGGKPAVIATVRLAVVMEKLDQRAEAEANLTALGQTVKAEDTKRKDEILKMQDSLDAMRKAVNNGVAPPEAVTLQEQLALKTLQYQAWSRFTLDQVDIEKALLWQDLYRNIKSAAAQMASANGYDLVLVDDSQGEIETTSDSRASRSSQVMSQIIGRRTLHVNPTLDITDELITRMNNAHKAAGAAPTAPAVPKQ
jgi:Skp family chaperone for outer membrane proteins